MMYTTSCRVFERDAWYFSWDVPPVKVNQMQEIRWMLWVRGEGVAVVIWLRWPCKTLGFRDSQSIIFLMTRRYESA